MYAYWVPMKDSKGETVYLKAPRVDYILMLLGIESSPVRFKQYPQLARHAEELAVDACASGQPIGSRTRMTGNVPSSWFRHSLGRD